MKSNNEIIYMKKKNDSTIAYIPVGSIEVHGGGIPLGTDAIISCGCCKRFAEAAGGVVFPPVYYGVCPNTNRFYGTIGISVSTLFLCLKEIVLNLFKDGYQKVIIISIHNGNDATIKAVIQELFIETNKVVYYINPYTFFHNDEIFKNFDNDTKEASLLQACCEILDIKFDYTSNEDVLTKKNVNLKEIKKYGYIGYTYDCETQHIAPRKDVYADKGNQYINDICLQIAKILDNLEEHISQNDEKMGELWKK